MAASRPCSEKEFEELKFLRVVLGKATALDEIGAGAKSAKYEAALLAKGLRESKALKEHFEVRILAEAEAMIFLQQMSRLSPHDYWGEEFVRRHRLGSAAAR